MTDQPLFRSAETALLFAFAICETEIYAPPVYVQDAVRQAGKSGRLEKMAPHDWHAQGSIIRGMVAKLDTTLAAYGWALHAWSPDRAAAIDLVEAHTRAALPGTKNSDLLRLLVRRYLDRGRHGRLTPAEIARQAGVHHSTAAQYGGRVKKVMDALHWQFHDEIHAKLADAGLIPSD